MIQVSELEYAKVVVGGANRGVFEISIPRVCVGIFSAIEEMLTSNLTEVID